jgi:cell division control protein 6
MTILIHGDRLGHTYAPDASCPSPKIFSDKRVLELDYVPSHILHRDEQVKKIQSILTDMNNGVRPRNILCIGDFGTGKTAVVRSVCRDLSSGCRPVYVNCAEENTQSRIIRAILRQFDVSVKTGFPKDHYLRLFKENVARWQCVVLVLDEVDKFVEREDSECNEFFYTLSRSVNNVATIFLTNRVSFEVNLFASLDARVRDTFRFERVEFGDYIAPELSAILMDRCRIGLRDETYDIGIVAMLARISYAQGLRARGIIDLARKTVEVAEAKGHVKIEEEDVRQASSELSHERELETVQRLPPIHRRLLAKILIESPSSGIAYEWYRGIAPDYGAGQSLATFHTYLKDLETMELVRKQKRGRGRGKGLEMRLVVPPEIADIVRRSLEAG